MTDEQRKKIEIKKEKILERRKKIEEEKKEKEEKYKKLNSYLNDFFLRMSYVDPNLSKYLYQLCVTSDYINEQEKKHYSSVRKNMKLTYEDVYLLAREIISTIDEKYLVDFDNLMSSGVLDFAYEEEYDYSNLTLKYIDNQELREINIKRYFNYDDVASLIHEYIHSVNRNIDESDNTEFLTEFISIYFEEYAKRYIIEKFINDGKTLNEAKEDVCINERILSLIYKNNQFNKFCLVLLAYDKLGNINENTPDELKNVLDIGDKYFEEECFNMLDIFENNGLEEAEKYFSSQYKYLIGTILAYYALDHCNMKDIVKLNNLINTDYNRMNVDDILDSIGIKLNFDTLKEAMKIINEAYYNYENTDDKVIK